MAVVAEKVDANCVLGEMRMHADIAHHAGIANPAPPPNFKGGRGMRLTIFKWKRGRIRIEAKRLADPITDDLLLTPAIVYAYTNIKEGIGRAIAIKWIAFYIGIAAYVLAKEE